MMGFVVGGAAGAGGEMEKVTQAFQPDGRFSAVELSISLKIKIALHAADRKKEPDLGTYSNYLGLEAADTIA